MRVEKKGPAGDSLPALFIEKMERSTKFDTATDRLGLCFFDGLSVDEGVERVLQPGLSITLRLTPAFTHRALDIPKSEPEA